MTAAAKKKRLSYPQRCLVSKIAPGKELLIVGAGWCDYYAVEPDQVEPAVGDPERYRDVLVGVKGPTIDALIRCGVLVLRREARDRTQSLHSRTWLRRWYEVRR